VQSEIACHPSVGGSGPHRLKILETKCTDNQPNTFALRSYAPRGTQGNFGETIYRRGVGKMACWNSNMSESVNTEEKGL